MKKSLVVKGLLELVRFTVLFLPFIVSFRGVYLFNLGFQNDLFLLFINFLAFALFNFYFTILIPRNFATSKYSAYVFAVIFLIGQIVNLVLPIPAIVFSGIVNGVLTFNTFAIFFFNNFGVLLYMFVISLFLEHEIGGE